MREARRQAACEARQQAARQATPGRAPARWDRWLLVALALAAFLPPGPAARAEDVPVGGARLQVGARSGGSFELVARDAALVLGRGPGSPDDPTLAGGRLTIRSGAGESFQEPLPDDRWQRTATGWRVRRVGAIRKLDVRPGALRIVAEGALVPLLERPDPVSVVLELGALRLCLRFDRVALYRPGIAFLAWSGQGVCPDASPLQVEAGPLRPVAACAPLELAGTVTGSPRSLAWTQESGPLVALERTGPRSVRFRAPAVAAETRLGFRLTATDGSGAEVSDVAEVSVTPTAPAEALALGLVPDCAPFRHGVASGDPRPDGIVIWTRLTPEADAGDLPVDWELALDAGFEQVVAHGTATARAAHDHTVKVDVTGLSAGQDHYYRFRDARGTSAVGRTRTAPDGPVDALRFAVASCSSLFSGFFNGYARIAERADLDAVIHLGDYIYDFVDPDEQVRIPDPFPVKPQDLAGWRARHALYLQDPDLRQARAMHPWLLIWDNHDVDRGAAPEFAGSVQAFREWNPLRAPETGRPDVIYRRVPFGDLAEVILMDALLFRDRETVPGTDAPSILGSEQFAWLEDVLASSSTAWRVLGSQKLFSTLRVDPRLIELFDGNRREVFDLGAWDGFPEDRSRVLDLLARFGLGDNVMLSGDSHVSLAFDLVDRPADPADPYDPTTGERSQGVELLPTSISRGNFDEALLGGGVPPEIVFPLIDSLLAQTLPLNPHHRASELTLHGYGLVEVTPDAVAAGIWYTPILERSDQELAGPQLRAERGANRWSRE